MWALRPQQWGQTDPSATPSQSAPGVPAAPGKGFDLGEMLVPGPQCATGLGARGVNSLQGDRALSERQNDSELGRRPHHLSLLNLGLEREDPLPNAAVPVACPPATCPCLAMGLLIREMKLVDFIR